ncbi:MAG: hydrogenase 3 maturation endopeptidase HyCI [Phycisphaerales bacterium]|nr:MAG: hydrogenase 3 maturation endopeptidase HyCI [Phycisphaerales bacterium]
MENRNVVILGIGNANRGDDGVGPYLAERLTGRIDVEVINGEEIPERYTGVIRELNPDTIIILDAICIGEKAGAVAVLTAEDVSMAGYSTHNASIGLLMKYLQQETGAEVFLLGIQPGSTFYGSVMTAPVRETADVLYSMMVGEGTKCSSAN